MSKSEAKRIDIQMKAKLKEQQQQIDALNEELRLAREVVEVYRDYYAIHEDVSIEADSIRWKRLQKALTAYEQFIKANSPAGEMKEEG